MTDQSPTSLPELRAERGWSRAELAGRLDISPHTVRAIERGRYNSSLRLALRIGRLLEMRVEAVFGSRHG